MKIEVTAALWHKMLGNLPFAQVEAGLAKVFMTSRYFPTIAGVDILIDQSKFEEHLNHLRAIVKVLKLLVISKKPLTILTSCIRLLF